jgi:PhnB protein
MQLNSYLSFNGNCEEAFNFYAKCLDGKVEGAFTYGESPTAKDVPAEFQKKIMHATLVVGDQNIMGADMTPDRYRKPEGISLSIGISDAARAEKIFRALSDGANVTMPIQETFWAERFGMLTDKFGIPWMVNCSKSM